MLIQTWFTGVFKGALVVLVNDLCQQLCYIYLLLELLWDECEGLLCIYVMAGSWSSALDDFVFKSS